MSEEYDEGMELDEEELEELYEDQMEMDPEDVFKMCTINKIKKTRVTVELRDEEDDVVELKDVIQQLLEYIKDQLKDKKGNQFVDQILPLMAQSVVSGLGRLIGLRLTAFHLSNEITRTSIIQMMCVALLMLKFVQQNGLQIHTFEEDVTDEEIEEVERRTRAESTATLAALAGHNPREVLERLRANGDITDQDLKDILNEQTNGDDNADKNEDEED